MPRTEHEKRFDELFLNEIGRQCDLVEEAIAAILGTEPPEKVKILLMQTFPNWDSMPVQVFPMDDASPDDTYFKRPLSRQLVPKRRRLVRERIIDQDQFKDAGVDTLCEWTPTAGRMGWQDLA